MQSRLFTLGFLTRGLFLFRTEGMVTKVLYIFFWVSGSSLMWWYSVCKNSRNLKLEEKSSSSHDARNTVHALSIIPFGRAYMHVWTRHQCNRKMSWSNCRQYVYCRRYSSTILYSTNIFYIRTEDKVVLYHLKYCTVMIVTYHREGVKVRSYNETVRVRRW